MELVGKIKMIDTTKEVGSGGFKKRDIVISTDEQYPQHILVQFVQDKCDLLDKFKVGQEVKVGINLRGRDWVNAQGETVYFNTIQGWNIFLVDKAKEQAVINEIDVVLTANPTIIDDDDLPF